MIYPHPPPPYTLLAMAQKLILLIDHEASVRTVLQVCLSRLGGWDVLSVSSLESGLATLGDRQPDAILLDSPALAGSALPFILKLRRDMAKPVPILLITSRAKWFTPQQLKDMGVVGALLKPFNPVTLPAQISAMLNWDSEKTHNLPRDTAVSCPCSGQSAD